jgi:hypothetical protein
MTRIYPLLTHSSPLNTPTFAWYFLFSRLMSSRAFKKPLSKQSHKPLHSCGVFLYDEGIKKTLVLLKPTSTGTKSTVAADALRFLFFFSRLFSPDHITSYACAKALNVQGFVFELHAGVPCYSTTQSLKNTFSSPPVCRILLRLSDSLITHLLST